MTHFGLTHVYNFLWTFCAKLAAIVRAEAELDKAVERAMAESGLTQDELADLFAIRRGDAFSC